MRRALLLGLLGLCGAARAITGNQLYELMQQDAASNRNTAAFYVIGVMEGHDSMSDRSRHEAVFCLPDGVTRGQAYDVVRAYYAANPAIRHEPAAIHTLVALARSWPCPTR